MYSVNECPVRSLCYQASILLYAHPLIPRACNRCIGRGRLLRSASESRRPVGSQEVEVQQVGPEEPEEEVECPSHEPASFVKGKPRSILSLPLLLKVYLICYIYCCIKYRSCDETFAAFYSILVQIPYHYLIIELGSSSSLAML